MREERPRALRRRILLSDERLARLASSGNDSAFSTLYERYHGPIYRYCRSILRDEADADDAMQSTFTHALDALQRGPRNAPLRPWLFRIAHNEAVSVIRRRNLGDRPTGLHGYVASAEDRATHREELNALLADLYELPDRQREALVMRELSGLSHEQIALALGTSVSAAKQAIFEARSTLIEFQEGRAMACEDVRRALHAGDRRVLRSRRVRAHVRDCAACAAFVADLGQRRERLRGVAPPLAGAALTRMALRLVAGGGSYGLHRLPDVAGRFDALVSNVSGAFAASRALVGVVILSTAAAAAGTGIVAESGRSTLPTATVQPGVVVAPASLAGPVARAVASAAVELWVRTPPPSRAGGVLRSTISSSTTNGVAALLSGLVPTRGTAAYPAELQPQGPRLRRSAGGSASSTGILAGGLARGSASTTQSATTADAGPATTTASMGPSTAGGQTATGGPSRPTSGQQGTDSSGGSDRGGSGAGGPDAAGSGAGGPHDGGSVAGGPDAAGSDAGGSDAGGSDAAGSDAGHTGGPPPDHGNQGGASEAHRHGAPDEAPKATGVDRAGRR